MIYRPKKPKSLWDTWLFEWEGRVHLFHLETLDTLWDHVGHVVSDDLVHWQNCPSIPTKGKTGEWDEEPTLTGMVVYRNGKFYMFVGSTWNKVQVVGVYISDDLYQWHRYSDNPVMRPHGSYYIKEPSPPMYESVDWRDPCISYRPQDGCYHALLCARSPKYSHDNTGATIAHLRSKDLLNWETLPPIDAETSGFFHTEVPDIFEMGGKYYLIFSTASTGGIRLDTSGRKNACGAFYLVSNNIDGPYTKPENYMLIGSSFGRLRSYVGRSIPYQGDRLLYHHISSANNGPAFGSTKMIRAKQNNSLYLEYMPVLEKLEITLLLNGIDDILPLEINDQGQWDRQNGTLLGTAGVVGTSCKIYKSADNIHLQCKLSSETAARAGVVLRSKDSKGVLIGLDFANNWLEIGIANYNTVTGWNAFLNLDGAKLQYFQPWDICSRKLEKNTDYQLRCFGRNEFFEVYLNDEWIFTLALDDAAKSGDIEFFAERGKAHFSELRLANIEPLS